MKRTLAAVSLAAVLMAGVAAIGVTLAAPKAQWSPQPLSGFVAIPHPSEAVDAATATASTVAASQTPDPTATPSSTTRPTPPPTPDPTFGRPPQTRPQPSAASVTVRTIVTKTPPPPPPTPAPVAPAPPAPVAPPAPAPVAGTTVAAARSYALSRIGSAQYSCLDALWTRESSWNPFARNRSSGAYGIPQALPGSKMAVMGADWATNPVTQVKWGLSYISARYGSACGAWSFWQAHHWY